MAQFNSYLLGKVRNSVGNITTCYMNKKNIAKAKIFARKDVKTPEIMTQRAKMKILVLLNTRLLPIVRIGFRGIGRGSSSNAFTATNMAAVSVDENYVATVLFENLLVAKGMIYTPKVAVTYNEANKQYIFEQEKQEKEDGFSLPDDKVYAALYEEALNRAKIVTLRNRGESGSTSIALPDEWDATKVHIYTFATTKNGKNASDSRYLTVS